MRPIDKGPCPQVNWKDKQVKDYKEWRSDLIERIGSYCAYCNMPISTQLNVEHVVPKKPRANQAGGDPLAWENMLLACENCNKAKSNKPSDQTIHYLPEFHNGLLPFMAIPSSHPKALLVGIKPGLNAAQTQKAASTIKDFSWDKIDKRPAVADIRWLKRFEANQVVEATYSFYQEAKAKQVDLNEAGKLVATITTGSGFFLLWFAKFAHEPEVLRWLADPRFSPGIATACFAPSDCTPLPRNPADPADPF
jgi:HNH endonuclease